MNCLECGYTMDPEWDKEVCVDCLNEVYIDPDAGRDNLAEEGGDGAW